MFFRREPDPDDYAAPPPDHSLATRLAWTVLIGGALVLLLRCSVATVVEIHGDGMAPNLYSGDHVLFVRGTWGLQPGDLVVYDPTPPAVEPLPAPAPDLPGEHQTPAKRRHSAGAGDRLRNTAVVDAEELGLDEEWDKVQKRSGVGEPARSLRVARIVAVPGDSVTFGDPRGALGLAIDGKPLAFKPGEPSQQGRATRQTAFETLGDHRYQVLASTAGVEPWPGMRVPADGGPYEMPSEGYLLLADNRDEGACCDSRAIGWVKSEQIRGEILLRLSGAREVPTTVSTDMAE